MSINEISDPPYPPQGSGKQRPEKQPVSYCITLSIQRNEIHYAGQWAEITFEQWMTSL